MFDTGPRPSTRTDHRFVETAEEHRTTARAQLDAAISTLDVFRFNANLPAASAVGQVARLLGSCARHLSICEEWS